MDPPSVIVSQAVLIALGIDWEGRRQVLAVELANRESASSWKDFLLALKARGLIMPEPELLRVIRTWESS